MKQFCLFAYSQLHYAFKVSLLPLQIPFHISFMISFMLSDHALRISYLKRREYKCQTIPLKERVTDTVWLPIHSLMLYPRTGRVIETLIQTSLCVTFYLSDYFFLEKDSFKISPRFPLLIHYILFLGSVTGVCGSRFVSICKIVLEKTFLLLQFI